MKIKSRIALPSASLALSAMLAAAPVLAQTVTVTNLHPAGASQSVAYATTGTQQVGYATFDNSQQAAIWSGTLESFQDVNPDDASASVLNATSGEKQFGAAYSDIFARAAIFSGGKTYIPLHPTISGVTASVITSYAGNTRGGYVITVGGLRAAIWTGDTDQSYIPLHPTGAAASAIYAISSTKQGGIVNNGGTIHAALWSGGSQYADLNPNTEAPSRVEAMSETQQAGYATVGGAPHAAIWADTAGSFQDLNPTNVAASDSHIYATNGSLQAGTATIGGRGHAGIWLGKRDSFIDLHAFLPADYQISEARGVWTDGTTTYVAGSASKSDISHWEAMLWTVTSLEIPPPPTPVPGVTVTPKPAAPGIALRGKARLTTTRPKLAIKGSATGVVTRVTYRIGKKSGVATGTAGWKFLAKLKPGRNKITVTAHGPGGDSAPVNVAVTRK